MHKIFNTHLNKYLALPKNQVKSSGSIYTETQTLYRFGNYLLTKGFKGNELAVSRADIENYISHLTNLGQSPNTINTALAIIKNFYYTLTCEGFLGINPSLAITGPKQRFEPCKVLTISQIKTLIESPDMTTVAGVRDRVMLELLYSSAFRRSEIIALKIKDFDDDYRRVRFKGKGNKEAVIPVGKMAAHLCNFWVDKVRPLIDKKGSDTLLLSVFHGGAMNVSQVYRPVKRYAQALGIEKISPHVLRYSIATHLDEDGVDVKYIQRFLRHESIETTTRYINQGYQRLQSIHHQTHPREGMKK